MRFPKSLEQALGWGLFKVQSLRSGIEDLRDRIHPPPRDTGVYRSHLSGAMQFHLLKRKVLEEAAIATFKEAPQQVAVLNFSDVVISMVRKDIEGTGSWRMGPVWTDSRGDRWITLTPLPLKA